MLLFDKLQNLNIAKEVIRSYMRSVFDRREVENKNNKIYLNQKFYWKQSFGKYVINTITNSQNISNFKRTIIININFQCAPSIPTNINIWITSYIVVVSQKHKQKAIKI